MGITKETYKAQPLDMDCQGGSGQDFLSFHLSNDRGKGDGRSKHER